MQRSQFSLSHTPPSAPRKSSLWNHNKWEYVIFNFFTASFLSHIPHTSFLCLNLHGILPFSILQPSTHSKITKLPRDGFFYVSFLNKYSNSFDIWYLISDICLIISHIFSIYFSHFHVLYPSVSWFSLPIWPFPCICRFLLVPFHFFPVSSVHPSMTMTWDEMTFLHLSHPFIATQFLISILLKHPGICLSIHRTVTSFRYFLS